MTIFSRAIPRETRVVEEYAYQIEISANSEVAPSLEKRPQGRVEMVAPYDGYAYFTRQAIADLRQQGTGAAESMQIGQLIRQTPAIDEEGEWRDGGFIEETTAVTLPVRADYKSDVEQGRFIYRYQPTPLSGRPLQLTARLLDDEVIMPPSNEKYLRDLSNKARPTGLYLLIEIKLTLPYWLLRQIEDQARVDIQLTQFSLQWPTVPDPDQLNIWLWQNGPTPTAESELDIYQQVNQWRLQKKQKLKTLATTDVHEKLTWLYDPASRALRFEPTQPLWRVTDLPSQAAYALTATLLVEMRYPGDLYPAQGNGAEPAMLSGQFQLTLRHLLLSGSVIHYFNSLGRPADLPDVATKLEADFDLFLKDSFDQRETSTYWLMNFPGLNLTKERLLDIRHALGDLNYQIESSAENWEAGLCVLTCRRWETVESHYSHLDLYIKDENTAAQWEQEVSGGAKFTTQIPVGNLTIEARGRLAGGSVSLNHGLSQLQAQLKRRLYPLSALQ